MRISIYCNKNTKSDLYSFSQVLNVFFILLLPVLCFGQNAFIESKLSINRLSQILLASDSTSKSDSLAKLWYNNIVKNSNFPIFVGDTAHFYWYSNASVSSVRFLGEWQELRTTDFGAQSGIAKRLNHTNLWHFPIKLAAGSLFEYQIKEDKLLHHDAGNRHKGCNAQLQTVSYAIMPNYAPAYPIPTEMPVARGNVSEAMFVSSNILSVPIRYWVYTPPDYEGLKNLPVVYVLQGQNFLMPCAVDMCYVLDQLIGNQLIAPCLAVFIDSRKVLTKNEPDQSQNWLAANPIYLDFLQNELVPAIERDFQTTGPASNRALMGAGIGGLFSSWAAVLRPETFSMAAAIYPDFSYFPQVYEIFEESEIPVKKVFLASAFGYESEFSVQKLKNILKTKPTRLQHIQTRPSNSLKQVQSLSAGALLMFFPK